MTELEVLINIDNTLIFIYQALQILNDICAMILFIYVFDRSYIIFTNIYKKVTIKKDVWI